MKKPLIAPEVFDLGSEIKRRLKEHPDGKDACDVLKQILGRIVPAIFASRDTAQALMPKDADYQRVLASLMKWCLIDYALAHEVRSGRVKATKLLNPKNRWPSARLKACGLVIEIHSSPSPYGFVAESEGRIKQAKTINGQLNLFTAAEEFLTAPIYAIVTYYLDGNGKLWVMMGVPNDTYTGWVELPFNLLDFLGMEGELGTGGVEVTPVPVVPVSPSVKAPKEKEWKEAPLTLTGQG